MDCPLKYRGQTGQTFKTRYKEHIQSNKEQQQQLGIFKAYTEHREHM
jgi:hypothetical protein